MFNKPIEPTLTLSFGLSARVFLPLSFFFQAGERVFRELENLSFVDKERENIRSSRACLYSMLFFFVITYIIS